jgi:hypothetical protein
MHPNIAFYLARDGEAPTLVKIREQLETCIRSVVSSESHGSLTEYRGVFIDDAKAYAEYLGPEQADAAFKVVFDQVKGKRSAATGRQALLSDQLLACEGLDTRIALESLRAQPQAARAASEAPASDGDRLAIALTRLREHGIEYQDI